MNLYIIWGKEYPSYEEIIIFYDRTYVRRKTSFMFPMSFNFAGVKSIHDLCISEQERVRSVGAGSEHSCLRLCAYMHLLFFLFALSS